MSIHHYNTFHKAVDAISKDNIVDFKNYLTDNKQHIEFFMYASARQGAGNIAKYLSSHPLTTKKHIKDAVVGAKARRHDDLIDALVEAASKKEIDRSLKKACLSNDLPKVIEILSRGDITIDDRDMLLTISAYSGSTRVVMELTRNRVSKKALSSSIFIAREKGYDEMATYLSSLLSVA